MVNMAYSTEFIPVEIKYDFVGKLDEANVSSVSE